MKHKVMIRKVIHLVAPGASSRYFLSTLKDEEVWDASQWGVGTVITDKAGAVLLNWVSLNSRSSATRLQGANGVQNNSQFKRSLLIISMHVPTGGWNNTQMEESYDVLATLVHRTSLIYIDKRSFSHDIAAPLETGSREQRLRTAGRISSVLRLHRPDT